MVRVASSSLVSRSRTSIEARQQSGYAADCKFVQSSSTLERASITDFLCANFILMWRVSKAVMQRIANSSSPVQLWNAPPLKTSFYPPLLLSPSAIFNCFNSYKWNYCFCLTLFYFYLLNLTFSVFLVFLAFSAFEGVTSYHLFATLNYLFCQWSFFCCIPQTLQPSQGVNG